MSNVQIKGEKELLAQLEKRLGKEKMDEVSDIALMRGAEVFVEELKSQFASFKDTGASIEEIQVTQPESIHGVRTVKIHWKGPDNRYRIIHLNEFGTVKNPNPKGKGAIARAMMNAKKAYRKAIKDTVMEGFK
ncbi:hypothetical protein LS684_21075 (plasmid) [Cytobacillus spongiae]|uniref:hypothetical protein n=1 Tax=Cytobacillus spongiae TaxID=2901381 RepID=UPI001F2092E3|nr:hypothetical protein [Cytobacillus spongiae]UII58117.1 hypothetical protein LS684_21075 [Cytobacillus spongiae]